MSVSDEIRSIYASRNILKSLIVKNIFGRYKNSFLGILWHFIVPLTMLFVYYVVFTQIRIGSIPDFWIYISSALFPFTFMTSNLTGGASCVVNNSSMIKKMYFPRELIVLAQVTSSMIIMLIGYSVVLVLVAFLGQGLSLSWICLPFIFFVMFIFVLGYTLFFSSIIVYMRDVQHFLNSISIVFFFITPMYFLIDSIDGFFRCIVEINPFTCFVEMFHQIVYYGHFPDLTFLIIGFSISFISLIGGYLVFNKLKRGFVERL